MLQRKWLESLAFEIVIEVDLKTLKHDADVALMGKALIRMHKVELFRVDFAERSQNIHLHLPLFGI